MKVVNDPDHGKPRQGTWFGVDPAGGTSERLAGVVFNRPIDQILTYRASGALSGSLKIGQRVKVPLGRGGQHAVGYCVELDPPVPVDLAPDRIKPILEILDPVPLLDARMLELTRFMADYYACSWGQALDAVIPAGVRGRTPRYARFVEATEDARKAIEEVDSAVKLTDKQMSVMRLVLGEAEPRTIAEVARLAKCTVGPIEALVRRGLLRVVRRRLLDGANALEREATAPAEASVARPEPTLEQRSALERISPALESGGFAPFLIHGVTGSGKTELYLSTIERVVGQGREAIVLVPEISLTPQTIRRFRRRFPRIAVLHSHMGDAERKRHWSRIAAGEVQVVIGARSAIFAPTRRLGLIVIDEEHETSFKQETTPRYHARDLAVKRASLEGIPILLGSATPSLESWRNAELGRYTLISMPSRALGQAMPAVAIIDLREEKLHPGGLSEPLRRATEQALADGGQVILMLNRRGYHTFVLCPRCGQVLKCHACDVALTYHKDRRSLLCHTCNAERACPSACPGCQAPRLHYGGLGTERLEREIATLFPGIPLARMDSDTMTAIGSHERTLAAFKAGESRILLGTQMIAKGLDFPNVTLVGVVNADVALHLPDFRASERTFQLCAQVAGRTGRGDRPGRVLIQTYAPDHAAIRLAAAHDYESFAKLELTDREAHGLPPFGRIARIVARGPRESVVGECMAELARELLARSAGRVRILGPAPAPILKIRNLFRVHLQLRAGNSRPIQALLREAAAFPAPRGVEISIDVDPMSML